MENILTPSPMSVVLHKKLGSSDKIYQLQLEPAFDGDTLSWVVKFQYGRRGATLVPGIKTKQPEPYEKARKIYDKKLAEQLSEGYGIMGTEGAAYSAPSLLKERQTNHFPQLLKPIEEEDVEFYLTHPDWCAEEKFDGKNLQIRVEEGKAFAINRKGLQCGTHQKFLDEAVKLAGAYNLHINGEAVGERLRVFDLLEIAGHDYRLDSFGFRRDNRNAYCGVSDGIRDPKNAIVGVSTAMSEDEKRYMLQELRGRRAEGIVFKKLGAPWHPGVGPDMVKFKFKASATCLVVEAKRGKRSVLLAVAEMVDGISSLCVPREVGYCTIPSNHEVPAHGDFVEIKYLYAYRGGSLFQAVYNGVRDDKSEPDFYHTLKFKADDDDGDN